MRIRARVRVRDLEVEVQSMCEFDINLVKKDCSGSQDELASNKCSDNAQMLGTQMLD